MEIVPFEPGEKLLRWYYGRNRDYIHMRIVLTNHRLMVFGERGLIHLRWTYLPAWTVRLEEMNELTLGKDRWFGPFLLVSGRRLSTIVKDGEKFMLRDIKEVRARRLVELSHKSAPLSMNDHEST